MRRVREVLRYRYSTGLRLDAIARAGRARGLFWERFPASNGMVVLLRIDRNSFCEKVVLTSRVIHTGDKSMNQEPPSNPPQTPVPHSRPAPALFGQTFGQAARMPINGKIRPGVMVPAFKWKDQREVMALYKQGVAEKLSFHKIQKNIEDTHGIKNALVPKNVPYFTIRPEEFADQNAARAIIKKYGDDKGRIFRFPVMFLTDIKHLVMPMTLGMYGASGIKYWQETDANGVARCKERVVRFAENGAVLRTGHGRDVIDRQDNGGICIKEKCREYQKRQCKEHGSFVFTIPGVPGAGTIEVPTDSFYSREEVMSTLEMIAGIRGTVAGPLAKGKTFWMSKVLRDVPRIEKDGAIVQTPTWLICLTTDLDFGVDFDVPESSPALAARGEAAAKLLTPAAASPAVQPATDNGEGVVIGTGDVPPTESLKQVADEQIAAEPAAQLDASESLDAEKPDSIVAASESKADAGALNFKALSERLKVLGIPLNNFSKVMAKNHGAAWLTNVDALTHAGSYLDKLEAARKTLLADVETLGIPSDEFEAYASKVKGEHWFAQSSALQELTLEVSGVANADEYRQTIVNALL